MGSEGNIPNRPYSRAVDPGNAFRGEGGGLAPPPPPLGVYLSCRLHHGVEPLAKLFMAECSVQIELWCECLKNGTHAYTLLCGESMPVIVSVIAHIGMEGFPTIVIRRHLVGTFLFLSAAVYWLTPRRRCQAVA